MWTGCDLTTTYHSTGGIQLVHSNRQLERSGVGLTLRTVEKGKKNQTSCSVPAFTNQGRESRGIRFKHTRHFPDGLKELWLRVRPAKNYS